MLTSLDDHQHLTFLLFFSFDFTHASASASASSSAIVFYSYHCLLLPPLSSASTIVFWHCLFTLPFKSCHAAIVAKTLSAWKTCSCFWKANKVYLESAWKIAKHWLIDLSQVKKLRITNSYLSMVLPNYLCQKSPTYLIHLKRLFVKTWNSPWLITLSQHIITREHCSICFHQLPLDTLLLATL